MSSAVVLRVEGLAYRYGKTEVFADASFSLRAGEVAFLTGPNGAGKSTLLGLIANRLVPTSGRILVDGEPAAVGQVELCGRRFDGSDRGQRSLLAFVPDVPSFYDDLTAGEHVRFVRQANRMSVDNDPSERLMFLFGLDGHRDQLPSSYSRGMRQKLALVLALARMPRLLLLDEPYGPLDPDAALVLSALIEEARSAGAAVLASCHHDVPNLRPDVLLRLADERLAVWDARDGEGERAAWSAFGADGGAGDA